MSKIRDAILGFAVGDAFGVPYEFGPRQNYISRKMIGFKTHYQQPGTWSDDTSMVLATLYSIVYDEDIMNNFVNWYNEKMFTPHGVVFDIGSRTMEAITWYISRGEFLDDLAQKSLGNGSLMRILPLAFFDYNNEQINEISAYTHPAEICQEACRIYVKIIRDLCKTGEINLENIDGTFARLSYMNKLNADDIYSTGYVVDTLEAAIWSVVHSKDYESAIINAVKLGGDTDTIAAIAGGMAGILYGVDSIPQDWLDLLVRRDFIEFLCEKSQDKAIF